MKLAHGRPREVSRRHGLHQDSLRRTAVEGLRTRTPRADRSGKTLRWRLRPGVAREIHEVDRRRWIARAHQVLDGDADHDGDTSYIARRRQGPQHGQLRAEPAQRLRHGRRDGGPRVHLQLPRRLLLARARAKPTRSRRASGRAARCRARW